MRFEIKPSRRKREENWDGPHYTHFCYALRHFYMSLSKTWHNCIPWLFFGSTENFVLKFISEPAWICKTDLYVNNFWWENRCTGEILIFRFEESLSDDTRNLYNHNAVDNQNDVHILVVFVNTAFMASRSL